MRLDDHELTARGWLVTEIGIIRLKLFDSGEVRGSQENVLLGISFILVSTVRHEHAAAHFLEIAHG